MAKRRGRPTGTRDRSAPASGRRWSNGRDDGPRRRAWRSARGSSWRAPRAGRIRRSRASCGSRGRRSGAGGGASCRSAWTGWSMSRGPGTPRRLSDAQVEQVITDTLETTPRDATHWSTRTLAKELGAESQPRSAASGAPSACSRIAARRSSSRATRSSSTKCATSSASISAPPDRALGAERRRKESDSSPGPHRARFCR